MTSDENTRPVSDGGGSTQIPPRGLLSEILAMFRASHRSLCAEEVAERLGRSVSSVEAMLGHLLHFGYIEPCEARSACEACPMWQRCGVSLEERRFFTLAWDMLSGQVSLDHDQGGVHFARPNI
jgi:hypothetical protein